MFACGGVPLLVVGERFHHRYGNCGKSCARLRVVASGWFLAALVYRGKAFPVRHLTSFALSVNIPRSLSNSLEGGLL
jgi:hypothetical protein